MTLRSKNRVKNLIIFLLIVIILFFIYKNYFSKNINFFNKSVDQKLEKNINVNEKIPLERITVKLKKYKEENETNKIDMVYPEIYGLQIKKTEDQINTYISKEAFRLKDDFFDDLTDEVYAQEKNEFVISDPHAEIAYNFVNIDLTTVEYASGGAHPVNNIRTYVFNSNDAHRVGLSEIFTDKSSYLKTLSKLSEKELAKFFDAQAIDYDYKTGILPIEKNYSQFLFDQDDLAIFFNPYQVAPYVVGVVKIKIPWTDLEPYLTADFQKRLKSF